MRWYQSPYYYGNWRFYFFHFMGEDCIFLERFNHRLIYMPYDLKNKAIDWNRITYYTAGNKYYIADFELELWHGFKDHIEKFIKLMAFE